MTSQEPAVTVPPQAIDAAAEALETHPFVDGLELTGWTKTVATVVLEAAAPHIRADERERMLRAAADTISRIDDVLDGADNARIAELEQLAADILATFTQGSDGYRARAGKVQIARWNATLKGTP